MGDEQQINQEDLVPRIGTFLILLGLFAFILFVASDFAEETDFDWLFGGMVLMAIGWLMRRRAPPPPSAGRFAGIKKVREDAKKRKQAREEKKKAKKDKKK